MEKHCTGVESEIYEQFQLFLRSQGDDEPFDKFLTALRTLVRTCKFVKDSVDYSEEMVRHRIVCGIKNALLRQKLLMKDSLNLATCVKECRASEASR